MGFSTFSHAKIAGISTVVPPDEICIDDELEYYDNSQKKVERVKNIVGINTRRYVREGTTASDLCLQAAERLIADMKIEKESIDALIFISQTPDHRLPATACILQNKLGLSKNCAAFDANQGCTAFTYGLWLASSLIESRACTRVLVLVGETSTPDGNPKNRITCPVFGDSGTATILEYSEEECISHYSLGTDGSGAESLITPIGHARCDYVSRVVTPKTDEDFAQIGELFRPIEDTANNPWYLNATYMDGGAIFCFTFSVVPPHIIGLLEYAKTNHEKIDYLVLHQANKQIAQSIAKKVGFPLEKTPIETMSKFGNLSGASIPAAICDQLKESIKGKKVKTLLAGYGVGLSWASCVLELDNICCSGVNDYVYPENIMTREEYIEYWKNKFKNN